MYIDRHRNQEEYPYQGTFYIKGEPKIPADGNLFAEDGSGLDDVFFSAGGGLIWANDGLLSRIAENEELVVLSTKCDVTEAARSFVSGAISAMYDVFYPIAEGERVNIDRGYLFRANVDGLNVAGMVVSVGHSELGGVHAYVRSSEV